MSVQSVDALARSSIGTASRIVGGSVKASSKMQSRLLCHGPQDLFSALKGVSSLPKIRIQTLGGLQVFSREGRPLAVPSRKAQALLAYLAMARGRPQSRDKLSALLWEDRGEVQARASLRQELTVLRKVLNLGAD